MFEWNFLQDQVAPNGALSLKEVRIQAHHAVQPIAAAGAALIPARSDYTHTSLTYVAEERAFFSVVLSDDRQLRGAVYIDDLALAVVVCANQTFTPLARQSLVGWTLEESFRWFESALADAGVKSGALSLPVYPDFPEHSLARDGRFTATSDLLAELRRYYANTALVLQQTAAKIDGASAITVWPHHFDMATLIAVKTPSQPGGEDGRSVGVGLSPGDASNERPYWYVTPWPYPDPAKLPALSAGQWHTQGWVGALLDSREVLAAGESGQAETVTAFLNEAIQASLRFVRNS